MGTLLIRAYKSTARQTNSNPIFDYPCRRSVVHIHYRRPPIDIYMISKPLQSFPAAAAIHSSDRVLFSPSFLPTPVQSSPVKLAPPYPSIPSPFPIPPVPVPASSTPPLSYRLRRTAGPGSMVSRPAMRRGFVVVGVLGVRGRV